MSSYPGYLSGYNRRISKTRLPISAPGYPDQGSYRTETKWMSKKNAPLTGNSIRILYKT